MLYPADLCREQLPLRPWQRQAIIQGIEKSVSGNPALLLDENAIHRSKLHGRTSETEQSNARPDAEGLG